MTFELALRDIRAACAGGLLLGSETDVPFRVVAWDARVSAACIAEAIGFVHAGAPGADEPWPEAAIAERLVFGTQESGIRARAFVAHAADGWACALERKPVDPHNFGASQRYAPDVGAAGPEATRLARHVSSDYECVVADTRDAAVSRALGNARAVHREEFTSLVQPDLAPIAAALRAHLGRLETWWLGWSSWFEFVVTGEHASGKVIAVVSAVVWT
jgi:hypothetical protein